VPAGGIPKDGLDATVEADFAGLTTKASGKLSFADAFQLSFGGTFSASTPAPGRNAPGCQKRSLPWLGKSTAVKVVEFTLIGQPFMAMSAGPLDPFNHSFSIIVECETQAEVDRLWDALKEGGSTEQCGWLKDRWGLSWQITPKRLGELMADPDRGKAKRVAEAMLKMVKFDIAGLEAAAKG